MRHSHLLPLMLPVLLLSGCGAADAIQATKSMPDKMDGMIGKMDTTNANMGVTNAMMGDTNAGIHKQTLLVALNDMLSDRNSEYLAPVPTGMLPGGETFAEEATALEIVKLAYVFLQEIDEVQPDESQANADGSFPDAIVKRMDHQKFVKFSALEVIAGLAPQKTIDTLIQEQIIEGGRYEDTAYSVLMCRALFLRDIMLNESLFRKPIRNLGTLEEAIKQTGYLETLAQQPFVAKIGVKLIGMVDPDNQVDLQYETEAGDARREVLEYWLKLKTTFERDLDVGASGWSRSQSNRLLELRNLVDSKIVALRG